MHEPIFKENYRGPKFLNRIFAFMNRSGRFMNNIRGVGGCLVTQNEFGGLNISARTGLVMSRFAFGWQRGGTLDKPRTVLIGDGWVEGRYGFISVGSVEVEIGGNESSKQFILVEGDEGTAEIVPHSVALADYSGDTHNRWRRVLYRVYLRNGRPVLDKIGPGVGGIVL